MAEIKNEKTKKSWPWIIAGILILAIILYFLFFRNRTNEGAMTIRDTTTVVETTNPVDQFIAYVGGDTVSMNLDHQYTHEALVKLADATDYLAKKTKYTVGDDIERVRVYADKITNDPLATTHADNIKMAADLLGKVLWNIQQSNYPRLNTEANKVKKAARTINANVLTLDQKEAIKAFFNDASILIKKMN